MANRYLVRNKQTGQEVEVTANGHEQAARFGAHYFDRIHLEVTEWDGVSKDFTGIAEWTVSEGGE